MNLWIIEFDMKSCSKNMYNIFSIPFIFQNEKKKYKEIEKNCNLNSKILF